MTKGKYAIRSTATEGSMIDDMQQLKRTTQEIVGKKSAKVTCALWCKAYLYFGMIVPTDCCKENV